MPLSDAQDHLLDEILKPNVHIKDKEHVAGILADIIEGGKDKLQVIADFDMTLSCFTYKGERCDTCHNVLDQSEQLPADYKQKACAVRDHYYAIEIDPNLTIQEKLPYMVEWWTKSHALLLTCDLTKSVLSQIVRNSKIRLRDGCQWLFQELHKSGVPLLIFSAGVGDILEAAISQQSEMYNNMKIVSNYMDFDDQGKLIGFKGENIHVFNKNESAIHKSDYFQTLKQRENIILMGDSLGDLKMAHGATDAKHILKIGFLNDKVEERLDMYMDSYDIVIVREETIDIVNAVVKRAL